MVIKTLRLLYFSPTDTTRKILKAIAEGYGMGNPKHIDLTFPATRTIRRKEVRGGLTVIGAPVYTGRVALEAARRLAQFKAQGAPAVIVVVYGNREYEDALLELKNITVGAGFTPIAGAVFIGEHSFSTMETPLAPGRPDKEDLNQARSFGIMVRKKIGSLDSMGSAQPLSIHGNFPYRDRGLARNTSPETSDAQCVRCGKCAKVCPVGVVSVKADGVTTNKDACILCCACVKNCPTGARRLEDPQLTQFVREKLSAMCSKRKEPEFFL